MERVSAEVVDRAVVEMDAMNPEELAALSQRMTKEQPDLVAFLVNVDRPIFNQDERDLLLILGMTIWHIMSSGKPNLPGVTKDRLSKVDDTNLTRLEQLDFRRASNIVKGIGNLFQGYAQPEVMSYVIDTLLDEEGHYGKIRLENKWIIMMELKTVIDSLNG